MIASKSTTQSIRRKLHRLISKVFSGVTEREIQLYTNSIPKAQCLNPKFINKIPLKPVESSGVMNQVQIDLVDMSNSPVSTNGSNDAYKYILVVLDVFSRFASCVPFNQRALTR